MKANFLFTSNITDEITDEQYAEIGMLYKAIDACSRISNSSMIVIDFFKNKPVYRTEKLIFTDEATSKDIQRESPNPYWSLMVEEDIDIFTHSIKAYFRLLETLSDDEKLHHSTVMNYRIILNRHEYVITQKFSPLLLNNDNELWLGLFSFTASTHKTSNHITFLGKENRYKYDTERREFVLVTETPKLTLMEKAIIHRAAKGLTTEQIAEELDRSSNTIKTHKKRLFEKLKVNSISEALLFVDNYDLY